MSPKTSLGTISRTIPGTTPKQKPSPISDAGPAIPDIQRALETLGYTEFRPGQREAIESLLDQGHVLLVAPTGGGKSLIYQLPALLLDGTTVVISPLISLMQDQVSALEERGVAATFLASTLSPDELDARATFESSES